MKQKFTKLLAAVALLVFMTPSLAGWGQTTIYSETFGDNGGNNTAYASYEGYSATMDMFVGTGTVTSHYSGSGKVGKNSVSPSDYTGASGLSAAWYTGSKNSTADALIISGISIEGYEDLNLSFGINMTNGASTTNTTTVSYKIDNGDFQTLSFVHPTTSGWGVKSGSINGTGTSLTIKFTMATAGGYTTRYDDIIVTGTSSGGSSVVSTTTTIDASGITNTDVYINTAAGTLTATVTENTNNTTISGATVTWTSSNESVATIASDGTVTLVAAGTTNITASYAGVSNQYAPSTSEPYVLTVTSSAPYVQPNPVVINMNYQWLGSSNGGNLNANQMPVVKVDDNVTTTIAKGTSSTYPRGDADYIRIYTGSTLTFDAPEDYEITSIVFTTGGNDTWTDPSVSIGTFSNKTWTGLAESVVFTLNGSCFISKVTITIAELGNTIVTTVTIDDSNLTNTDVYISTVAGSLSAVVKDNESVIISNATVTWTSSDETVATIASDGTVTLVASGTTTITANFAGVIGQYLASSNEYELTVTSSAPYVQPMEVEANLNNTFFDCDAFTSWNSGLATSYTGTQDNVTITLDKGTAQYMYINTTGIRMYAGNSLTFTAPEGYSIISIELDGESGFSSNLVAEGLDGDTWTGSATQVEITGNTNKKNMTKVTITLAYPLHINGYGTGTGNWYLIASPVASPVTPNANNGFVSEQYDLYRFNQDAELEWENHKIHAFNIESGRGYLYANSANTTLVFTGAPYNSNGVIPLVYVAGKDFAGWNLIGNPFTTASTISLPYYKMNDGRTALTSELEGGTIAAMEGAFVYAYDETTQQAISSVTFTASRSRGNSNASVNIDVMHNGAAIDNAIVRFDEGRQLPKYQLFKNSTKLYITKNGKDYAIVNSEAQGEMPVNFKAEENGTYTLSINTENVEMNYLHLIDNMTGMDVDLLQTPSYTFDATTNDYTSRFRLVFSANNVDGPSTGSGTFAFYSNGNWVVNNEGEATLQVIDVNGRIVSNETINGSVNKTIVATPGVYMLRLVNGNEVKTQKIVVR